MPHFGWRRRRHELGHVTFELQKFRCTVKLGMCLGIILYPLILWQTLSWNKTYLNRIPSAEQEHFSVVKGVDGPGGRNFARKTHSEGVDNTLKLFDLRTVFQREDGLQWPYKHGWIERGKKLHTISVTGALVVSTENDSNDNKVLVTTVEMLASPSVKSLYSVVGQTDSVGSKPWSKSVVGYIRHITRDKADTRTENPVKLSRLLNSESERLVHNSGFCCAFTQLVEERWIGGERIVHGDAYNLDCWHNEFMAWRFMKYSLRDGVQRPDALYVCLLLACCPRLRCLDARYPLPWVVTNIVGSICTWGYLYMGMHHDGDVCWRKQCNFMDARLPGVNFVWSSSLIQYRIS